MHFFLFFVFFTSLNSWSRTIECTNYEDQNIKYTEIKLEIYEKEMIVSFPEDLNNVYKEVYPRVVDQGFKLSGFINKTDVISGAIWTFGVDLYKTDLKLHRYIATAPGMNLLIGKSTSCVEMSP
jgi:hypothetical protein